MSLGGFSPLFNRSVPHILERIFSSLDYDSLTECQKVCKTWHELLSSDSYKRMTRGLLIEKKKNEEKLCLASKRGATEEVGRLLSNRVDPNCWGEHIRNPPLHIASRFGIHDCRNCIYDRKLCNSVVDLLVKSIQFWKFGQVSKSNSKSITTAMNPNPG